MTSRPGRAFIAAFILLGCSRESARPSRTPDSADDRAIYALILKQWTPSDSGWRVVVRSDLLTLTQFGDALRPTGVGWGADSALGAALLTAMTDSGAVDSSAVVGVRVAPRDSLRAVRNADGIVVFSLSRIAYSADGNRAAVSYSAYCGGLCGAGAVLVLTRDNDSVWRIVAELERWDS